MNLQGGFAALERGPGEQRQAQIDGGGIQRINRLVEFQPEIFVGVELPGLADQDLRDVGVDASVAFGVGQRVPGDGAAKTHVVEPWLDGAQTDFDIAQALAGGELGEGETQELVETAKALDFVVSAVALDRTAELGQGEQIAQLGENTASGKHAQHRTADRLPDRRGRANRFLPKPPLSRCKIETYTDFVMQRWDSSG